MKAKKFNFSKAGIKEFFFRHVEKVFFGLACGLIVLFLYLGLATPKFNDISPKEMLTKTEQAEKFIRNESHWNTLQVHRQADTEAAKRIEDTQPIDPDIYSYRHLAGTAVFTLEPRRDPALLPAEDFQVQHIRAQVARVIENTGDDELEDKLKDLPDNPVLTFPADQRMEMFVYRTDDLNASQTKLQTVDAVVGMALIDHKKQLQNYKENFQYQRGYDPNRDIPEYAFIEVQRKTKDSEWKSITKNVYEITAKYLAEPAKELADEEFLVPTVALPVPPFLGLDYRQFSLHPKVPTRDVFAAEEVDGRSGGRGKDDEKDDASDSSDPWDRQGGASDDESEKKPKAGEAESESEEAVTPYRLVRFYDLGPKTVGETYYYRLRVWLKDPNNPEAVNADIASQMSEQNDNKAGRNTGLGGMADKGPPGGKGGKGRNTKPKKPLSELDLSGEVRNRVSATNDEIPEDIKEEEKRKLYALAKPGEWVEALQPVKITDGFETFIAGPVDAAPIIQFGGGKFEATEPSIKIVANSFQDDLGVFVPAETETMKGSLLNFKSVTNVLDPLTWTIKELFDSEDSRGQKTGRYFETDAVVLDIMGGERQPFSRGKDELYAPGECLIMDRNGRIHLHSDVDDEMAYRHANFRSVGNVAAASRKKDDDDEDDNSSDRGGD